MNDFSALEKTLEAALEEDLLKLYGPVLSGEHLTKSLGYVSTDAFRTSIARKTVPVPIFRMDGRRGYYALTKDVAHYLAKARYEGQSGG
ncbi:hypothetical protein NBRC116583_34420 [Arenicella sp. 4NH20-0111]|uniref:hypothetical protein n=1 Tax=Arenicella sp. 4NH20-0111 TaxID=3127648 RepID=UPI003101F9B1